MVLTKYIKSTDKNNWISNSMNTAFDFKTWGRSHIFSFQIFSIFLLVDNYNKSCNSRKSEDYFHQIAISNNQAFLIHNLLKIFQFL